MVPELTCESQACGDAIATNAMQVKASADNKQRAAKKEPKINKTAALAARAVKNPFVL